MYFWAIYRGSLKLTPCIRLVGVHLDRIPEAEAIKISWLFARSQKQNFNFSLMQVSFTRRVQ